MTFAYKLKYGSPPITQQPSTARSSSRLVPDGSSPHRIGQWAGEV
jgi:hypothetical protein